ncbi:uncharacterized protein LOC129595905 isoform X2 [Paramacrobiotus metropolitanus]|nr:uncharacterized protein LOC129595905 isoform X2 [Paramacrobiotus metropolitanus]
MHTKNIWQHSLIKKPHPVNVYIALRANSGPWQGAYVFRPGQILMPCHPLTLLICCIATSPTTEGENSNAFYVVHRWQVVAELPHSNQNSIFGRLSQIPFVKHVIPLEGSDTIAVPDESRIVKFLDAAFRNARPYGGKNPQFIAKTDRLFVKLDGDKITFVILDILCLRCVHGGSDFWAESIGEKMSNAKGHLLESDCNSTLVSKEKSVNTTKRIRELSFADVKTEDSGQVSIAVLPLEIISEIFAYLDSHSLDNMRRICGAWNLLLANNHVFSGIVIIDFYKIRKKFYRMDTDGYRIAFILDKCVCHLTSILVLVNMTDCSEFCAVDRAISSILRLKSVLLGMVILKNYYRPAFLPCVLYSEPPYPIEGALATQFPLSLVSKHCKRLILVDFKVAIENRVFYSSMPKMPGFCRPCNNILLTTTIPYLSLDISQSNEIEVARNFKNALEQHCLPLEDEAKHQLKLVYTNWIRDVPFSRAEWTVLKTFLKFYDLSVPTSRFWENLDWTNFQALPFGKLAQAIAARDYLTLSPNV